MFLVLNIEWRIRSDSGVTELGQCVFEVTDFERRDELLIGVAHA
jgi:hypothetical protein